LLALLRRIRLAKTPASAPQLAATIWYERMLRQVARRGWAKAPAQTPEEFSHSIGDAGLKDRVSSFTAQYEKARFGGSVEEASRLPELYEAIKKAR
jgi:hypothetical protein